tara:strand:- start:49 stop:411 length:363 start_codon:yes stop_codon:yes gene_type:complete
MTAGEVMAIFQSELQLRPAPPDPISALLKQPHDNCWEYASSYASMRQLDGVTAVSLPNRFGDTRTEVIWPGTGTLIPVEPSQQIKGKWHITIYAASTRIFPAKKLSWEFYEDSQSISGDC